MLSKLFEVFAFALACAGCVAVGVGAMYLFGLGVIAALDKLSDLLERHGL